MDEYAARQLRESLELEEAIWIRIGQLGANPDTTDLRVFMAKILLCSTDVENWGSALDYSCADIPLCDDWATVAATSEVVNHMIKALYEDE
jgi:hypothetical protein